MNYRKDLDYRKEDIIWLYELGLSANNIKRIYSTNSNTVSRFLIRNGIVPRNKGYFLKTNRGFASKISKKHSVNESYFSTPNPQNCYWAGFIAADGCITDDNGLAISLAQKDEKHLYSFKNCVCYSGDIKTYHHKDGTSYSRILVYNKKIVDDLESNFNVVRKKTKILQPPNLTGDELIKAFIVGYIDGDGYIGMSKNTLYFSILGTETLLMWIRKYLLEYSGEKSKNHLTFSKGIYVLSFANKKAEKILGILKCVNVPKLERKWHFLI